MKKFLISAALVSALLLGLSHLPAHAQKKELPEAAKNSSFNREKNNTPRQRPPSRTRAQSTENRGWQGGTNTFFLQDSPRRFYYAPVKTQDGETPKPAPVLVYLEDGRLPTSQSDRQKIFIAANMAGMAIIAPQPAIHDIFSDGRPETVTNTAANMPTDAALVQGIIAAGAEQKLIDPDRVIVMGLGGGGVLAQHIACTGAVEMQGLVIAFSGTPEALAQSCKPAKKTPLLWIYASNNKLFPIEGGIARDVPPFVAKGRAVGAMLPMEKAEAFWAQTLGCGSDFANGKDSMGEKDGLYVAHRLYNKCGGWLSSAQLFNVIEMGGAGANLPFGPEGTVLPPRTIEAYGKRNHAFDIRPALMDFFKRGAKL